MGYKTIDEALPFLKGVDPDRQAQFRAYFKTAPLWLLESFQIEEMEKNTVFIQENAPLDYIYFVGKGIIEAIDYRFCGITYEFMRFDKVYAMGGMEFIMDLPAYKTTLRTVTRCTMVKLSLADFSRWMRSDIYALKHEALLMGEYLLEQGRKGRALLFLQGSDRLAMLFVERYERYARNGVLQVHGGQQTLSNATGLCLKTINRAVKKFAEQGLITKQGTKLSVHHQQYLALKEIVASVVDCES